MKRLRSDLALAIFAVAGVVLGVVIGFAKPAGAGSGPMEVLLVNMTPDALATKPSDECVKHVRHGMASVEWDEEIRFQLTGETRLRKRVKMTNGEPFVQWPDKAYERAKNTPYWGISALVLVDCRPETKVLNLAFSSTKEGVARIQWRRVVLDKQRAKWIGVQVAESLWDGFVP